MFLDKRGAISFKQLYKSEMNYQVITWAKINEN